MPADLKERLKAFVPPPVEAKIKTLAALPAAYDLPYTRWNSKTKTQETGTEDVPLTVRETERTAQRELLSVLRLVDAGKVAVSDKTRRASSATIDAITNVLEGGDYYICEFQYGSFGYDNNVCILEERYLYCLLLEYAATLGLIDVALIPPEYARSDYRSMWGTDDMVYFSRYDGLMFFRVTPLGAHCLGAESGYQPAPVEVKLVLRVLPNLEIAAIGADLEQSDRLALDAYATQVSDLVWRLDAVKLLTAIEAGRSVVEIQEFLSARSGAPIPDTVARLLADVADRSAKVHDRGLARLIECADPALAALIANDSRTRKHCLRAGERHLVVPASSEAAFKRTLREVGYLLAMGETRRAKNRRVNPPDSSVPQGSEA
jgi:hypothetical protein